MAEKYPTNFASTPQILDFYGNIKRLAIPSPREDDFRKSVEMENFPIPYEFVEDYLKTKEKLDECTWHWLNQTILNTSAICCLWKKWK